MHACAVLSENYWYLNIDKGKFVVQVNAWTWLGLFYMYTRIGSTLCGHQIWVEWNNCCQLSFYGIISALVSEIAHMKQLTLDDVTILRFQLFVFLKVCKGDMRGLSLHFLMVGVILIVLCHCQHATFQLQNNPLPIVDYKKKTMPFRVPFLCLIFFIK